MDATRLPNRHAGLLRLAASAALERYGGMTAIRAWDLAGAVSLETAAALEDAGLEPTAERARAAVGAILRRLRRQIPREYPERAEPFGVWPGGPNPPLDAPPPW